MAFNITPIYAKQYIRYSETYEAANRNQANSADVSLGEFCVVAYAGYAGANQCCAPGDLTSFTGPILGVNQAYIPTATEQPQTARQASIASSGMLIVDVAAGAATPALNSQLKVNGAGRAVGAADTGTAVTVQGTTPLIREIVEIGGRKLAVVSFN